MESRFVAEFAWNSHLGERINGSARQSSDMVPVQLSVLPIPPHVHRAANTHQLRLQVVAPDPRSAAGPPAGGDSMIGTLQRLR